MANIIVTGFPYQAHLRSIARYLKKVLSKDCIDKFWIRELEDIRGTQYKQANVELSNYTEARIAKQCLHGNRYMFANTDYVLESRLLSEGNRNSPPRFEDRGHRFESSRYDRYSRSRSRSPFKSWHGEVSKLDVEIEMLRKQRQVIEEERRLLVEKKKLEMMKEYGPKALNEPGFYNEDRRSPPHKNAYVPRRYNYSAPASKPRFQSQHSKGGIPLFVIPCIKLIAKMSHLIAKYAPGEERNNLIALIKLTIRKRISVALENKGYKPSAEIIILYRNLYPISTDETLVRQLASKMRDGNFKYDQEINIIPDREKTEQASSSNMTNMTQNVGNDIQQRDNNRGTYVSGIYEDLKNDYYTEHSSRPNLIDALNEDESHDWVEGGGLDWNL